MRFAYLTTDEVNKALALEWAKVCGIQLDLFLAPFLPIMYISTIMEGTAMDQVSIADIRDNLADALNRVAYGGERIVLTRRGKGVAGLVSIEDMDLLQMLEDRADAKTARNALKEKGTVPLDAVKARLGMK